MVNYTTYKKYTVIFFTILIIFSYVQSNIYSENTVIGETTALLIIDVQNFYFPGGTLPLVNPEKAAENIKKLLYYFRSEKKPVIHICHNVKKGGEIYKSIIPTENEKIIYKNFANSFRDTGLLEYLKEQNIGNLVITGMQTHMCVEAATRAASDYGFKCIVISDACTTREIKFGDKIIGSDDVHYSTLSSLSNTYAEIVDTGSYLNNPLRIR